MCNTANLLTDNIPSQYSGSIADTDTNNHRKENTVMSEKTGFISEILKNNSRFQE